MTEGALTEGGVVLVAILARVGPAIWIAPFWGGRFVPATVRLALSLMLAMVLYPLVAPVTPKLQALSPLVLGAVVVKEAMIGAGLGFVVAVAFWAAEAAGWLADRARTGIDRGAASPMANLMLLLTILIFVLLGGHRIFIAALASSYEALPLITFPSSEGVAGFVQLSMRLTADLILVAVSLAAPVLATLWLADLALGVAGRGSASANSFFVVLPLRAVLGVLVVALAVGTLAEVIPEVLESGLAHVGKAVEELGTRN